MKHTKTPWMVDTTVALGAYGIWTDYATHPGHDGAGYGSKICSFDVSASDVDVRNANAAHIVRCVNSHEQLVAACEALDPSKCFAKPSKQLRSNPVKMCPHCGRLFSERGQLIPKHRQRNGKKPLPGAVDCPGSWQRPRNPEPDRRPLWNGQPNPHAV